MTNTTKATTTTAAMVNGAANNRFMNHKLVIMRGFPLLRRVPHCYRSSLKKELLCTRTIGISIPKQLVPSCYSGRNAPENAPLISQKKSFREQYLKDLLVLFVKWQKKECRFTNLHPLHIGEIR